MPEKAFFKIEDMGLYYSYAIDGPWKWLMPADGIKITTNDGEEIAAQQGIVVFFTLGKT